MTNSSEVGEKGNGKSARYFDEDLRECGEKLEDLLIEAPDGGWGWVVVASSFLTNLINDGLMMSFAILLPEIERTFPGEKAKLSLVGSLLTGMYLLVGPPVSGLVNKFGFRSVTIAGALLCTLALIISSFATNIYYLYGTYGLLLGTGCGMIYLPSIVVVSSYFDKRRALATGIAVCGSGCGTFVITLILDWSIAYYGWRGALLIMAGLFLNIAVLGALFRPVEFRKTPNKIKRDPQKSLASEESEPLKPKQALPGSLSDTFSETYMNMSCSGTDELINGISAPNLCKNDQTINVKRKRLISDGCQYEENNLKENGLPSYAEIMMSRQLGSSCDQRFRSCEAIRHVKPKYMANASSLQCINKGRLIKDLNRPFYRHDVLLSTSLKSVNQKRSNLDLLKYHQNIPKMPEEFLPNGKVEWACSLLPTSFRDTVADMLDLELLKSPTFSTFLITGFLALAGFYIPFFFSKDRAEKLGIPKQEANLIIQAIGIGNIVGRILAGWISDQPCIEAFTVNNISLLIAGFVSLICPFFLTFPLLIVYAVVFGISVGSYVALRAITIGDLIGVEKLSNGFGLLCLFQGVATTLGAPTSGLFFDITGNYDTTFYIAGGLISASGLICFTLKRISAWENRKENNNSKLSQDDSNHNV